MWFDFTEINTRCTKDLCLLPTIDHLIDGHSDYKTLSFTDAYSGQNQIKMDHVDPPKTTLMYNHVNYYYNNISFGINNIYATLL